MSNKCVSVYMNAFNAEAFIEESINSILNQTYKNIKLVVIDDCSTDKTLDIVKSIKDERLSVYSLKENSHMAISMNEGLKYMDGDYIAHCDADDIWKPEKIQKQLDFLENNPQYGACFTHVDIIDDKGNVDNSLFPVEVYNIENKNQPELLKHFLNKSNHFAHSAFFARNEIVKKVGFYDVSMSYLNDFDYWLRTLTICPIWIIQEKLTSVRIHSNNASKMNEKKWNSHNSEYKRAVEKCIDICPDKLFLEAFKDDLTLNGEHSKDEVIIEKAFILEKITTPLYYNPVMSVEAFSKILNDEKLSKIAKEKFGFTAKSLYRLEETKEFSISDDNLLITRIETDENIIKDKNKLIIEKDSMIMKNNAVIEENNKTIQEKDSTIKSQIETIDSLSSAIKEKDNRISELQNIINTKELQIQEFQNSFFWRITKFPRAIIQSIKDYSAKHKKLLFALIITKSFLIGGPSAVKRKLIDLSKMTPPSIIIPHTISNKQRHDEESHKFNSNVKISILVPLYNTPKVFLEEMIESVVNQTYKNWELCLADGSTDEFAFVGEYCKKIAKNDSRIKYEKLPKNEGISENTNYCLGMATGDYIALFDHDDYLHPSVLFEVMKRIEDGADYIYTDEATFLGDDFNNIITCHYKPDFAFDNLIANNYICHFSVFKSTLVTSQKLFRTKYDGSQDHDLILRLTDSAKKIVHIPEILYFWRSHANSVAMDINSKKYAINAGINAVHDFLESKGLPCHVESSPAFPTIYRIKYEIKDSPKVSIIIPNKNHYNDLFRCINSIISLSTYENYEIIVIDNQSTDKNIATYYKELESNKRISIYYYDKPFNYSAINNFAVSKSTGDYLLFLNNDTKVITPEWIEELLMYAQRSDVGAVGAKLFFENDTVQHGGIILGLGADRIAGHSHYGCSKENVGYMGKMFYAQNVSAVTAACMMVRRTLFDEINGFDENLAVAFNDVDFCLKLRKINKLNVFNPFCTLYHFESISRGSDTTPKNATRFEKEKNLFLKKWSKTIANGDPYYNHNLSLDESYVIIQNDN